MRALSYPSRETIDSDAPGRVSSNCHLRGTAVSAFLLFLWSDTGKKEENLQAPAETLLTIELTLQTYIGSESYPRSAFFIDIEM